MVPRFASLFGILGFLLCVVVCCSCSVGIFVVEGAAEVDTLSGGSSYVASDDDRIAADASELKEKFWSSSNNDKLEYDELSRCLRVTETGKALDRWLHCLDALEGGFNLSPLDRSSSSSSSSLESDSQPSSKTVGMDVEIVGTGQLFDPLAGPSKVSSSPGFEDCEDEISDKVSEEQVLVPEAREEFVPGMESRHQISSSEEFSRDSESMEACIEGGLGVLIPGDSEPGAKELDEAVPDSCKVSQELQSEVLKLERVDGRTDTYKGVKEGEKPQQQGGVARTEDELKGTTGDYGFANGEFESGLHNEECEGLRSPEECSDFERASASVEASVNATEEKEMCTDVCTENLPEDPIATKTANVLKALKVAACIGIVGTLIWRNRNRLGIKSAAPPEQTVPSVTGLAVSGYSSSSVEPVGRFEVKAENLPAPLGNAIATVMAEVLEHERAGQETPFVADELAKLLEAAIVESLSPIMGSECSSFVDQFKQAFQSTYRLIGSVKVASARRLSHSGPHVKQSTRSHKRVQDAFPRSMLGRVAEDLPNGNLKPKHAQVSDSSTSDTGIETDYCDLQYDLAERFERLTFSSDNPEVEVGSTFTQRKTKSGHHGESLCSGSNGAHAESSAHHGAEIKSKLTTGTFSYGSGLCQRVQESFGEFDDMPSSSSRPPNGNKRTLQNKRDEGHDIHEAQTQGSHSFEGFRSSVREMDCHELDSGLFEGPALPSGSQQLWHERSPSPMETREELDNEANQMPPSQVPSGMGQDMVLSTLSCEGGPGNLQQEFLQWYKKSLAEKQQSNYLKTVELAYRFRRLKLDEEHLHLRSESNSLMRENVSMSRGKAELKEMEIQDRKLAVAYDLLSRTCADELVAGLFVMLCALLYGGWNYSYARLVDVISHCQPAVFQPSHSSMIPGFNRVLDSLNLMSAQMQMLFCNLTIASRMFLGLGVISMVAATLLRKSVTSSSQAMPATILLIMLGGVCGVAGKFAVDTMGGSGYHWLVIWESLCVIHACTTWFTPVLYWLLNGTPQHTLDKRQRYYLLNPWVRCLLFHGCLVLVLPATAGLLPFAPFREVLRTIFSTCLTIVYTPVQAFVTDKFKYMMLLN